MSTPDPCALFLSALHEDKDRITDIVHEKILESPSIAINRIKDGGTTNFNDNLQTIEYRAAKQAYKQYAELNDDPQAKISGTMKGENCAGITGNFTTNVNTQDENACHDSCLLDFGQGYRIRSSKLFRVAVTTPVVCAFDYIRMGKEHVEGYFNGMTEAFTSYGMENFEANLLNFVIQYGEANASVNATNEIVLTTGGFDAPPKYRLSIPFLRRYRQYMIREGGLTDTGLLDIETTRQDALDAIQKDIEVRGGATHQVNIVPFEDLRGAFYSKEGVVYDGIRFIFNELPVRGYFKPNGATFTFVRVYHWINKPNEQGGLSWDANHDYDKPFITCDGIRYRMCSLAFVINANSFVRYGLGKPMRKHGENAGANFEMLVLDKSYIECNDYNDKFRLAARHMFRFKTVKPELSGAIAYIHDIPEDYVVQPVTAVVDSVTPAFASPQNFEDCNQEGCCPDLTPEAGVISMSPCGPANSVWLGTNYNITFTLERTGDGVGAASATVTPTLLATLTAKVANWADGETGVKTVSFGIVTADKAKSPTFTLTKTGTPVLATCTVATVAIADGTV
jgi:hypothetical protein